MLLVGVGCRWHDRRLGLHGKCYKARHVVKLGSALQKAQPFVRTNAVDATRIGATCIRALQGETRNEAVSPVRDTGRAHTTEQRDAIKGSETSVEIPAFRIRNARHKLV